MEGSLRKLKLKVPISSLNQNQTSQSEMNAPETTKMTSAKFSEFVLSIDDLYNMGVRNGFYLPKQSRSVVIMLELE